MSMTLHVENIKCGGCANTIRKKLMEMDGVDGVEVIVEQGAITLEAEEALREEILQTLEKAGYPERGAVEGLASAKAKAVSFVSCAIGRMDKEGSAS
uniref:Putative Heavy metal transport/detoxification protein n=1 Tax=Magnetococcus massalia (strain MO-1) TaxID=451514 RepID=A0A1S7LI17_MAGMO|nr:putative Heavy metal transport/detoxification protein [Candidatus Magnetococcus massalia]